MHKYFSFFMLPQQVQNYNVFCIDNQAMIFQPQQQARRLNVSSKLKLIERQNLKDISAVEIYGDQLYIAVHQKIYVYKLAYRNGEVDLIDQRSFYPHCTKIHSIVASSLLLIVVPLKEQQLIRIWNRQKLYIMHGYKGHWKQISSLVLLIDKRHIASTSYDGTARIWSIEEPFTLQQQVSKFTSKYPLLCVDQFDLDSIVIGGDDCFIIIWNWRTKIIRSKFFAHVGSITCLSMCGYHSLYSMGGDSTIKIWKIANNMNEGQLVLQDNIQQSLKLTLLKQEEKMLSQSIYKITISNDCILIIDHRGNAYILNSFLEINQQKIQLDYTDQIVNVKIWRNNLFAIVSQNGQGKLNQIVIAFHEKKEQIVELYTKSINITDGTKNSIFIQPNQSNMEIVDL